MHILPFQPEIILYMYMGSCIAVLIFNIIFIFYDKYSKKKEEKSNENLAEEISEQMKRIVLGKEVERQHIEHMKKTLTHLKKLHVYEVSAKEVVESFPTEFKREYFRQMRVVFLDLVKTYRHREEIQQAYFSRLIEMFEVCRNSFEQDALIDFLIEMAASENIYVRENSLRALYTVGNPEVILSVWKKMQDNGLNHSRKLLADGLLSFSGDKEALASLLMKNRRSFNTNLNLAMMQFIRFSSGEYCEKFFSILTDESEDKEIRLETIRYLRRYPYEPVKEELKRFIDFREYVDWEYAAMAASALSAYPGEDTVNCLKQGLKSSNWYVRKNCAVSLISDLKVPQIDLQDIYNGNDRYAREILIYVTENTQIENRALVESKGSEEAEVTYA